MQVGLATNQLKTNALYMTTAYGFSVFAILGPLIPGGAILIALVILVVINWKFQKRNQQSVSSASTILKIEMYNLVCARSRVARARVNIMLVQYVSKSGRKR